MISMRYAWNLSHGEGLVWNPGEYVEGYTNLLMVLLMSLSAFIFDDKRFAVLAIQLAGILFMLGNAYLTMRIADEISLEEAAAVRSPLRLLAFFCTLAYYPLAYWSLMGMETGLLTLLLLFSLLTALRYANQQACPDEGRNERDLFLLSLSLGLAYLTRPDALIPAMVIWAYVFYHSYQTQKIKLFMALVALYLLFPMAQTIFRWQYYGELVPNTYTLKIVGIPLFHRIRNGLIFIKPFLVTNAALIMIGALGLFFDFRRQKLLLFALILTTLGYQVWAGGDPWPYWRMMAPVMPLLLLLLLYELLLMMEAFASTTFFKRYILRRPMVGAQQMQALLTFALTFLFILQTNQEFLAQMALVERAYKVEAHQGSLNDAIAIQRLTTPDATIAVFEAGVIPYYTGRVAIDFLGKTDKHVAHLPPDLVKPNWFGMRGVVGHNKYDLNYSIKEKKPTYVQAFEWGQFFWASQDISAWGKEAYTEVSFEGLSLFFIKDSDAVLWEQIQTPKNKP
jgi:hypothetical protein